MLGPPRAVVYDRRFFDETKPTETSLLGKKSKRHRKELQQKEGPAAAQEIGVNEVVVMQWVREGAEEATQQPVARFQVA